MRNGFVPATVVIDKPQCGVSSTKSSVAQIIDHDYFYEDRAIHVCDGDAALYRNDDEWVEEDSYVTTCDCTIWPCYHDGPEYAPSCSDWYPEWDPWEWSKG